MPTRTGHMARTVPITGTDDMHSDCTRNTGKVAGRQGAAQVGRWIGTLGLAALMIAAASLGAGAVPHAVSPQAVQIAPDLPDFGASARVVGLGGAFVGIADDPSTMFYNPAGLGHLREEGLLSVYVPQEDLAYAAAGYAMRNFGIGGSYAALRLDDSSVGGPDGVREYRGVVALGAGVGPLALGASARYTHESWPGLMTASGLGGDVGALFVLGPFRAGAVAQNLFGQFEARYPGGESESIPLDRKLVAGGAVRFRLVNAVVDYEVGQLDDSGALIEGTGGRVRIGAEVWLGPLGLRGGLSGMAYGGDLENVEPDQFTRGISLGLGIGRLDYAMITYPDRPGEQTHAFSLNLGF